MAQHDYDIANQSFPSFRSDLNSVLEAINTSNSGTSRPTSAVNGTIWLDTTNATTPTLKLYDGTDDISLATFDYSANTVNWLDSTVSADLVNDLSPQLGGMLDVNGNAIGNGTEELIKFSETASAVNEVTVTNSATGNAPEISATGDDTNIDLKLTPKGTGKLVLDGLNFPTSDGTTGQFLKTDGSGNLSFDDVGGGGKVLQVVSNSSSSTITSSVTTDTEVINTSITPSSTSNKILVIASLSISVTAGTNAYAGSKLRRGTNASGTILSEKAIGDSAGNDIIGFIEHTILDSPSTTSSQQYTMSFRLASGNTTSVSTDARVYNIILMEIEA
jgi:hypothetical protein